MRARLCLWPSTRPTSSFPTQEFRRPTRAATGLDAVKALTGHPGRPTVGRVRGATCSEPSPHNGPARCSIVSWAEFPTENIYNPYAGPPRCGVVVSTADPVAWPVTKSRALPADRDRERMEILSDPRPAWWIDDAALVARTDAVRNRLDDIDLPDHHMSQDRIREGAARELFRDLWDLDPFREYLPSSLGGSDGYAPELLAVLDTIAYQHLPLSLAVGITGALFVLPIAGHAAPGVALDTLGRVAGDEVWLGGMMMTEPGCGSDLLNARSTAESGQGRRQALVRVHGPRRFVARLRPRRISAPLPKHGVPRGTSGGRA